VTDSKGQKFLNIICIRFLNLFYNVILEHLVGCNFSRTAWTQRFVATLAP